MSFWHSKLCQDAKALNSLRFLRCDFLLLNNRPHQIWESCGGSRTAVRSATIQARLLSGRYRCDALSSKWSGLSDHCSHPGCGKRPGDIVHYLSGDCLPLSSALRLNLSRGLSRLEPHPQLHFAVNNALRQDPEYWVKFILDPSTDPLVIAIRQESGSRAIWPIFRLARSFIWCMHQHRQRFLKRK